MMLALALAAMSAPIERNDAMERCAQAVVAKRHPRMGMLDTTGTRFEWLSLSTAGADWMIVGSILEPEGRAQVAHRFACRTRGDKPLRVTFGKVIRL